MWRAVVGGMSPAISKFRVCFTVTYWVNRILGHGSTCTDRVTYPKSDPFDPLIHDPLTHCLLWLLLDGEKFVKRRLFVLIELTTVTDGRTTDRHRMMA